MSGPLEFAEEYPGLIDQILKERFTRTVRKVGYLRRAAIAGLWLGLVTESSMDAAMMLKAAIGGGVDFSEAAVSVAKSFGWAPGLVVENPWAADSEEE